MKALTVLEPWATLLVTGRKRFETRDWSTIHRGPLAIHAGKKVVHPDLWPDDVARAGEQFPHAGCIVGVVDVINVVPTGVAREMVLRDPEADAEREFAYGNFDHGRYAWEVRVLERFGEPIPARGFPSLWDWERP